MSEGPHFEYVSVKGIFGYRLLSASEFLGLDVKKRRRLVEKGVSFISGERVLEGDELRRALQIAAAEDCSEVAWDPSSGEIPS